MLPPVYYSLPFVVPYNVLYVLIVPYFLKITIRENPRFDRNP